MTVRPSDNAPTELPNIFRGQAVTPNARHLASDGGRNFGLPRRPA